ncbi:IMP cyclohydrolase [Methanococcus voltae]|uniref:IMP cyclohydrolase n=1 Tax=Methanococcus voltae TaxID=2188 RepID=A0A8J7UR77_METVO|nr:IMP cyclohydrolase [Methanococcus voltae]MBP2172585.1 IMP cyclohydrolase [Methanococcus voltae]MBP2201508.1 IMP cyclohydrolase [Methanococcus voltae]
MYLGRFLILGKTEEGNPFVTYRVSSRSFPNRVSKEMDENTIAIIPKDLEEIFKNTYITYNCVKIVNDEKNDMDTIVATNGSQTDIIADKIKLGLPIRDALSLSMIGMDYEKDDYNTPRISVVLNKEEAYMAYVAKDDIRIKKVDLEEGNAYYLSVYEACKITSHQKIAVDVKTAEEISKNIMEHEYFENPVTCATVMITENGIEKSLL